jgi:hypothetical protein
MATDVKLHEGKTLRGQLTTAIREKKGNQGRLSATFVRELEDQYGSDVDLVSKRLRVDNPSEEARASLLEARELHILDEPKQRAAEAVVDDGGGAKPEGDVRVAPLRAGSAPVGIHDARVGRHLHGDVREETQPGGAVSSGSGVLAKPP